MPDRPRPGPFLPSPPVQVPATLDELMLDQRRVLISGPLDTVTVNRSAAMLMTLDGRSSDEVTVLLNSPGGSLDDVVPLVDIVAAMRAPVAMVVRGRAASTAAVLLALCPGQQRTVSQRATISLQLETETAGEMPGHRLIQEAQRLDGLRHRLADDVAARTGQTPEWVLDQFDRGAFYTAADAQSLGLVDRIEP